MNRSRAARRRRRRRRRGRARDDAGNGCRTANTQAGGGQRFVARDGAIETRLRDGYQSLAVTVFRDDRSGRAATASLHPDSIRRATEEAASIAKAVQPDPGAGLADPAQRAWDTVMPGLSPKQRPDAATLMATAGGLGAAASAPASGHATVRVLEAGAASRESLMALATSAGFCRSATSSHYSRWITVLAEGAEGAVQDTADSEARRYDVLDEPLMLGRRAVERATARLGARAMPGGTMPVLSDGRVAGMIVHDLVTALGGMAQVRGTTFLRDAMGRAVAAPHVDLIEDPFIPLGMASGGFDGEGVGGSRRAVVDGGIATGYFLATRAARRLEMRSTGNANGPQNLALRSRSEGGDRTAMLARMGEGLLVTHERGGATDPVTGNWTRAVAGFRVVGGHVDHPVIDVTVGGNIVDMLYAIVAISDDTEVRGPIRSGAILIDGLRVGSAT